MKRIFRAGEKVRVSRNPINPYSIPIFVDEMNKHRGRIVTIARVFGKEDRWYRIKEDGGIYIWRGYWFEPLRTKKRGAKKGK